MCVEIYIYIALAFWELNRGLHCLKVRHDKIISHFEICPFTKLEYLLKFCSWLL